MRIVAEIPHNQIKISIFSWNSKYIIKLELGNFEQSFKIKEQDVSGLEDIKKIISEEFLNNAFNNFLKMRENFNSSFQKNIS
jgi:hypothetical protein